MNRENRAQLLAEDHGISGSKTDPNARGDEALGRRPGRSRHGAAHGGVSSGSGGSVRGFLPGCVSRPDRLGEELSGACC
jgi:hypothetical protein